MVNWDTHRISDILLFRETNEVRKWLENYPNIKIISRDGASTYTSAGRKSHLDAKEEALFLYNTLDQLL